MTSALRTWIFQANPKRYDIMAVLKKGEPVETWSISHHADDLTAGDRAVLWIGGQDAPGVYAVGSITGEASMSISDDPHWRRDEDRMTSVLRCPVHFDTVLLRTPVLKSELKSDSRFINSRIITQPFAGNPFPITDTEWQAIAERLPPPSRDTANQAPRITDWAWDEIVLACDLVADNGWQTIAESDPAVHGLSEFLRGQHAAPVSEKFRSSSSVHRKLEDIRTVHPAYGGVAAKGGKTTLMVVEAFLADPEGMHRAAQELWKLGSLARPVVDDRSEWTDIESDGDTGPEYAAAVEGRIVQRLVNVRERDPRLRKDKIRQVRKETGSIACEVCSFDFEHVYGELGQGFIHVHHRVPLHFSGETVSTLADLVLVCVNCHQMIHRRSPWKTPEDLAAIVQARRQP